MCTTRRAGKTSAFVRDAVYTSWKKPHTSVIYLNETRDRAKRTFWEELKAYVIEKKLPFIPNEATLSMHGPQDRWIFCGGGESQKTINRWKGIPRKTSMVYVDEAQDWDAELLVYAYTAVIAPALSDMGGRFTVGGVPGPIPDLEETWYAWTQSSEFTQYGPPDSGNPWSMWDNPHVKDGRKLVQRVMDTRMVDESDPTIQREFFGRWVRDTQILVFGALDDNLNAYDELPDGDWTFIAGVDFGYVDESAINVLGWARAISPHLFVTRNEAFSHTGAYETIQRLRNALEPLGPRLQGTYADPAAGGKNIADDMFSRHGIYIQAATKEDKVGAIKLMASSIANRELRLPRAHPLFRHLRRMQWDPDHRGEKLAGHAPDRCDALLYSFRGAYPLYSYNPAPPEPTYEEQRIERMIKKQEGQDEWS